MQRLEFVFWLHPRMVVAWPHAQVWSMVGRAKDTYVLVKGLDTLFWTAQYW